MGGSDIPSEVPRYNKKRMCSLFLFDIDNVKVSFHNNRICNIFLETKKYLLFKLLFMDCLTYNAGCGNHATENILFNFVYLSLRGLY